MAAAAVDPSRQKHVLKVAIIDWCPQICRNKNQPGYIIEIVNTVFAEGPYQLAFYEYPWTRGIMQVRSGELHALLAPTKDEAPNLLFPEREVGVQKMCFFRRAEDHWQFTGTHSLEGLKIGMVNDVFIREIDQYKNDNRHQFQISSYYDGSYIKRSLRMLTSGRLDTFIFTYHSTQLEIKKEGLAGRVVSAGCFSETSLYMAFSPSPDLTDEVSSMMRHFDKRIDAMWRSGEMKAILKRYQ
ncbi:hypothetical protein R50073_06080 [Maricurvus nonylphenolicus]